MVVAARVARLVVEVVRVGGATAGTSGRYMSGATAVATASSAAVEAVHAIDAGMWMQRLGGSIRVEGGMVGLCNSDGNGDGDSSGSSLSGSIVVALVLVSLHSVYV